MTPEQLQAALNALMEAGLPEDALAAATKALTDAFSATGEVSEDEAVDAMQPDAAATFRANETSPEDKAGLLKIGEYSARKIKLATAMALAKSGTSKDAKAIPAGFSIADLESVVQKVVTKAMPPQGRPAVPLANPTGAAVTGAAGFSAKIKSIAVAANVNEAKAMLMARNADPKAFNEWVKAGKPQ